MKKIIIAIAAVLGLFSATSCSDMLNVEDTSQVFDPDLDQKSDSVFYTLGIMQAMQQLADMYVLQGEMRGDNVELTSYASNNLRQLANFSATTANKYDSAYVYYRVINNCNYYIAHRDTTLMTGSTNVVMNEYAAVKAFRAWAYLQLARNYGKVPFFTEPLTTISQINNSKFPELSLKEIVAQLAPDLKQYSGYSVPNDGTGTIDAGSTNFGDNKKVIRAFCFIPVDVILGEMYLEVGDYANAAKYYTTYLLDTPHPGSTNGMYAINMVSQPQRDPDKTFPNDYTTAGLSNTSWSGLFSDATRDIVSYIPMAVNQQRGTTTQLPSVFGFDYYSTSSSRNNLPYTSEAQLKPSTQLETLSDTAKFYYYQERTGALQGQYVNAASLGDTRLNSILHDKVSGDSTVQCITKYNSGNIILYRLSTIYLHLAEALNRLGYPDAAFAILKDGINENLTDSTYTYVSKETKALLTTTYPFLSNAYVVNFPAHTNRGSNTSNYGIHAHGAGITADDNFPNRPGSYAYYNYETELSNKLAYLRGIYGSEIGTTKADSINAMEDLLCDEYQLEFAFEGTRWYDLMRLARHKNEAATYGSDFGSRWLARKLSYKNPSVDLTDENNWYLPFK